LDYIAQSKLLECVAEKTQVNVAHLNAPQSNYVQDSLPSSSLLIGNLSRLTKVMQGNEGGVTAESAGKEI